MLKTILLIIAVAAPILAYGVYRLLRYSALGG